MFEYVRGFYLTSNELDGVRYGKIHAADDNGLLTVSSLCGAVKHESYDYERHSFVGPFNQLPPTLQKAVCKRCQAKCAR